MTGWRLPFPKANITSPFGWRTNPLGGGQQYHSGVDFGGVTGQAILAAADGTVAAKGYNAAGHGHWVWVHAYDGSYYEAAHMAAASPLAVGAAVTRGVTSLGNVGSSGAVTGPHLHFVISTGTLAQAKALDRTYLVEPIGYMEARPATIGATQRQVLSSAPANRRLTPDRTQPAIDPALAPNEIGNFNGWIRGESVSGNNIWFRGISGNWFWSGGFTDIGVHDLPDLNPVVEPTLPTRTVRSDIPNGRVRDNATTVGSKVVEDLNPGQVVETTGFYAKGESVAQNGANTNIWYELANGWAWAGSFTEVSVAGLQEKAVELPEDPDIPDPYTFEADFDFVTAVRPTLWDNFENQYSVPNESDRKGFPANPEKVVIHDFGTEGVDTFEGTISWFRNPVSQTSAHFIVSGKNIVQMVSLRDRAWHAGPGGNDYVGIESDPRQDPETIESVRKVLEGLKQKYGHELEPIKHSSVAATSCGDDINLANYQLDEGDPTESEFQGFLRDLDAAVHAHLKD